ncbi:TPA: division septum protein Blr [Escherichia coli]|nr:division septum protein Blr [Escherichia coli]
MSWSHYPVILLGVASHIDNYQPPEQSASVQHK